MKPLAASPDAEHIAVDYLTAMLAAHSQDVTCGVNVPTTWAKGTKAHVQVGLDGTPEVNYPILWRASVRVTTWHESTTTAKALAAMCEGLLLSHPGSTSVGSVKPLTGVLPTRDPDTDAQLATISVQFNLLAQIPA